MSNEDKRHIWDQLAKQAPEDYEPPKEVEVSSEAPRLPCGDDMELIEINGPRLPCGDENEKLSRQDKYPEATQRFGSRNVETALIMVSEITHPISGLAISLPADDEALLVIIEAAFAASRREELNSESWADKLSDAVETVRYTFKLPIVLLPNGWMRITENNGDIAFEGNDWDFVHYVRDQETFMIPLGEALEEALGDKKRGQE